jgi:DNA-directed RNA polymerase subunit M/transcription elongation factor TFIIS
MKAFYRCCRACGQMVLTRDASEDRRFVCPECEEGGAER